MIEKDREKKNLLVEYNLIIIFFLPRNTLLFEWTVSLIREWLNDFEKNLCVLTFNQNESEAYKKFKRKFTVQNNICRHHTQNIFLN